jgi:hypothetical protein
MVLLDPNQSYTFSKYFELGFEASELAAEFDYQFIRRTLNLPQFAGELDRLMTLDRRLKKFEQGLDSYRVPQDLETLMRTLVAALKR